MGEFDLEFRPEKLSRREPTGGQIDPAPINTVVNLLHESSGATPD